MGLQDAARKRHTPSMEPGPWAGSIVHTHEGQVIITISRDRWIKAQGMILWIHDRVTANEPLDHKLEQYRGYLIYISQTHPFIVPYLKDLHLTIDSWRANRDIDGWKLSFIELQAALSHHQDGADYPPVPDHAPKFVTAVPQLLAEIQALKELFSSELPPKRPI